MFADKCTIFVCQYLTHHPMYLEDVAHMIESQEFCGFVKVCNVYNYIDPNKQVDINDMLVVFYLSVYEN